MSTLCPVCKKDDVIQKVSAAVSSGKSSGSFSGPSGGLTYGGGKWGVLGGYTTLSGKTASQLAQQLAKPQLKTPGGFEWWMLFLVFPAVVSTAGSLSDSGSTSTFLLVLAILMWSGVLIPYLWKKAREEERYAVERPLWEKAVEVWSRSYYCFRDDVVFDPKTGGGVCRPQDMKEFLYAGTGMLL